MGVIASSGKIKYLDGLGQSYAPSSFTMAGITGVYQVITDPGAGFLLSNGNHVSLASTSTGALDIDISNRHWQFKAVADMKSDEGSGNTNYEIGLHIDGVLFAESVQKIVSTDAAGALLIFHPVCIATEIFVQFAQQIDLRIKRTGGTGASVEFKTLTIEAWMD